MNAATKDARAHAVITIEAKVVRMFILTVNSRCADWWHKSFNEVLINNG